MRLFVLPALLALAAPAQVGTSRLEGTIQDPTGAALPGARVTAERETGVRATLLSNSGGLYVLPSLAPGRYTLTVELAGFQKAVVSGIALNVSSTVTAPVRLEIGPVTETLTVEAYQTPVQASDVQGGQVIALGDIKVLPQLQRNAVALAVFQPGVQVAGGNLGFSRINGARQGSNAAKLDGVDTRGVGSGLMYTLANSEFVQEFRVLTHSAKAEYGRSAGGQIEMVTRSGGNRWSGALFEFHRNTALNANDFFNNASGIRRPDLVQNTFGGAIGGPLRRERTFLFAAYQAGRIRQDLVRNRLVLTPEAKAGVFRWRHTGSADIQAFDIARNDPRGKGIDSKVAETLRLLPEPNNFDAPGSDGLNSGGFRFNNPADVDNHSLAARLDHNLSRSAKLFFRYTPFFARLLDISGDAPFPGLPGGTIEPASLAPFSVGWTWVISPRTIHDLRAAHNDVELSIYRPQRLPGPMLVANGSVWTNPLRVLFPERNSSRITEITSHVATVHGNHTVKTGINLRFLTLFRDSSAGIYPNVSLASVNLGNPPPALGPRAGSEISIADRARFELFYNHLLGHIGTVQQTFYSSLEDFQLAGTPRVRRNRNLEVHGFLQDDWKLRRNLSLSLGLRYEWNGPPSERDGFQGSVDRAPEIGGARQISDLAVVRVRRWYGNDRNNFAPRFGLAWDPRGDGNTALRVSYGIYYDALAPGAFTFADTSTPGFLLTVVERPNAAPGSDIRLSDGIPAPAPPAAPQLRLPAARSTNIAVFDPNLRTAYVQQYSFSIQRAIARDTVVEAAFVGSRGVKLFMQLNQNQRKIHGNFLRAFRQLQMFRTNGFAVPSENTLVRLFGSVNAAVAGVGAGNLDRGEAGLAADNVDLLNYRAYAAVGISDYYIRNFPQYNAVIWGSNAGRSYYDSLQLSVRRRLGTARVDLNYTWSKNIDTISTEGESFDAPIDSYNVRLNRARSDADRPHVLTGLGVYSLPVGRGHRIGASWPRWTEALAGGWDVGTLAIWDSGGVFSARSGRQTAGTSIATFADYTGDRNSGRIERRGAGVFWFSAEELAEFSFPAAGETGKSGRNTFRGPSFFNLDLSLVKSFRLAKRHSLVLRGEAYNVFNHVNFANPDANLATPATLGRISSTVRGITGAPLGEPSGGPRIVQVALRWEF